MIKVEKHRLTPNAKSFFDNIVNLIVFVREKYEESQDETLLKIYFELIRIYKFKGGYKL